MKDETMKKRMNAAFSVGVVSRWLKLAILGWNQRGSYVR